MNLIVSGISLIVGLIYMICGGIDYAIFHTIVAIYFLIAYGFKVGER